MGTKMSFKGFVKTSPHSPLGKGHTHDDLGRLFYVPWNILVLSFGQRYCLTVVTASIFSQVHCIDPEYPMIEVDKERRMSLHTLL